jgi:hypothetical protein
VGVARPRRRGRGHPVPMAARLTTLARSDEGLARTSAVLRSRQIADRLCTAGFVCDVDCGGHRRLSPFGVHIIIWYSFRRGHLQFQDLDNTLVRICCWVFVP